MKRLFAFFLSILIVCTSVYPAFAENETQQFSPVIQSLIKTYSNGDMPLLIERSNYGYMQFASNFRSSVASQYLIQMTDNLIDTGYEPNEAKYIEVLSNIILTYDYNNAADISYQAQLDDLKGFKEYAMDAKNATVDIVSILSGNNGLEEALQIAIDGISVLIDSTDNWLEALYDLDTVLQDYSFYDFFLEAVEENSDGELKSAASKMRNCLSSILQIRLESYADTTIENFDKFGEFFISDVFVEILKNTSQYQNDEAMRFFIDEAGEVVNIIGVLEASWDLGKLIGKTVGNVVVGGENLVNRILEIEALYDISCALQTKLPSIYQEALTDFSDEKAEQTVHLAQMLINCRIRGEYCEYSILASDAGLLSWADMESAEDALAWYESQSSTLLALEKRFIAILSMGIITGMIYTTDADGAPTALNDAAVTVIDSDGTTVRVDVMSDSNEYTFVLPAGTYTITAELEGYETASKEVSLVAGDVLNVDFEMEASVTEIELTDYYGDLNSFIELVGLQKEDSNTFVSDSMRVFFIDPSIMKEFVISNTNSAVSAYGIKIGDNKDSALTSVAKCGVIIPIVNSYYENELSVYLWDEVGDYSVVVIDLVFDSAGSVESWSVCNWPEGDWVYIIFDALETAHQIGLTELEDWQISYIEMLIEYTYDYYEGYLSYVDGVDIPELILMGSTEIQPLTISYFPDGNSVTSTDILNNYIGFDFETLVEQIVKCEIVEPQASTTYTDDQLCDLAIAYFNFIHLTNTTNLVAEIESNDGDNVIIWLYYDMDDHVATVARYEINRYTACGIDFNTGEAIQLANF